MFEWLTGWLAALLLGTVDGGSELCTSLITHQSGSDSDSDSATHR